MVYLFVCTSEAQVNHNDYINSSTDKQEFSDKQWKKLKGKMKSEASGNSDPSNSDFTPSDYSPSTENYEEGDFYDYYEEEYKGEFSEYQNYENDQNSNYEYSEFDDYESYTNDNYHYEDPDDSEKFDYYEKPYEKSQYKPKTKIKPKIKAPNIGTGGLSILQGLLIVIGVILVAFLVYYLFMRFREDGSGAMVTIDFDEMTPSEIPKTELERRLDAALAKGDYREAIRIYFIFIIKDLSNNNWIKWEKKKTNISYLMEMRSRPQYELFNKSVSIFEVVWYGNYTIDKESFNQIEPTFKNLLDSIK